MAVESDLLEWAREMKAPEGESKRVIFDPHESHGIGKSNGGGVPYGPACLRHRHGTAPTQAVCTASSDMAHQ